MSVVTQYSLEEVVCRIHVILNNLSNSHDLLKFLSNLNQLIQILIETRNSVRSQRNIYGTQFPCALLVHTFGFLPPFPLERVCKSWWSALKSPLAKKNPFLNCDYYEHHLRPLYLYQELDILDTSQTWCIGRIAALDSLRGQAKVHLLGWGVQWDEWIDSNSERLALLGSKCGLPSDLKKMNPKNIIPGASVLFWNGDTLISCTIKNIVKIPPNLHRVKLKEYPQSDWLHFQSRLLYEQVPQSKRVKGVKRPWDGA